MKKKKLLIVLIGILIIGIVICITLLIFIKKNKATFNNTHNDDIPIAEEEFKITYNSEKVKVASQFFAIETCIKKELNETFEAKDMRVLYKEKTSIYNYSVYGQLKNENNRNVYYIVTVDMDKMTYRIQEVKNTINNIEEIDLETNVEKIESNEKNSIKFEAISNEKLCKIYYEKWTNLERENPQEAYEKLDEEYKKIRFPTFEEYMEYLNDNIESIERGVLSQYSVEYKDNYKQCILSDTFKNIFIINVEGVMDYKIQLDNYTIKSEDYNKTYKEMKTKDKVSANCYIFMQMINSKDYKHAYQLLDETFKQNNFNTIEKFKAYVKNEFFKYNYYPDSFSIEQKDEYFVTSFDIRSSSASAADRKKINIIMDLKENADFVMSFSFN